MKLFTLTLNLFLLTWLINFSFSQSEKIIYGNVVDQLSDPLVNAHVLNENDSIIATTDSLGSYLAKINVPTKIYVKHEMDLSEKIKVRNNHEGSLNFTIQKKIQLMDEVYVTRSNVQVVFDEYSTNVLDYVPMKKNVLVLKEFKRKYYLSYKPFGEKGEDFMLDIRPKRLFTDCLDNYYIVTKDSAYHISIKNDGLHYVNILSIKDFKYNLKSCVVKTKNNIITEKTHSFNTGYNLELYSNDSSYTVYSYVDTLNLTTIVNEIYYNQVVRMKNLGFLGREDLRLLEMELEDTYGVEVDQRPLRTVDHSRKRATYSITSRPVYLTRQVNYKDKRIFTFKMKEGFAVLNFVDNSAIVFSDDGKVISKKSINIEGTFKYLYQDFTSKHLYILMKDGGNHKVYAFNPINGQMIYAKNFKTYPNTSNVRISDGWLYFKYLENNYYDIKRVRLPEFEN